MFGYSMFRDMQQDPFFEMESQVRQMNQMMQMPYGMMSPYPQPQLAIAGDQRLPQQRAMLAHPGENMFGMFGGMMGNMRTMMSSMQQQVGQAQAAPSGQFYSHSSVMTYDGSGGGAPKVYQATSSTHQAPGGVKETRSTVRDSEKGIERIAVGHHIRDRSHVVQRSRDRTGNMEENQDLVNLDENEVDTFDREFRHRMEPYARRGDRHNRGRGRELEGGHAEGRHGRHAHRRPHHSANAAIEYPDRK